MKHEDRFLALHIQHLWRLYLERAKDQGKLTEALRQLKLEQRRCIIQSPALIAKFNAEHAL